MGCTLDCTQSSAGYRRDATLREDACHLTKGHLAHALALITNLVLGLLLRSGQHNVPRARRY